MKNKMKIAAINCLNINSIIDKHIELVTNPVTKGEIIEKDNKLVCVEEVIREAKAAPRRSVLFHKYVYLLHLIIIRCITNKSYSTHLSYQVLTEVLGKHYTDMLQTLHKMRIIDVDTTYSIGNHSRRIVLINKDVSFVITKNLKVIEYANKVDKFFSKNQKNELSKFDNNNFIKNYNKSLFLLELKDKDEAIKFISELNLKEEQFKYYYFKIESFSFDKKEIYTIDKNKRIYHYLTNLPRPLKSFFNIKFQLDISNSHPLLFSKFIIDKYNINHNILNILLSISVPTYKAHYAGKQLYNILNNNNIQFNKKELPFDLLHFLYSTSKGIFWDNFVELFDNRLDRSIIKQRLFQEVFYSRKKKVTRYRPFAKLFRYYYPNVWKLIKEIKKDNPNDLPNMMMQQESGLFYSILQKCYEKKWKVVNIHDAIIILDAKENDNIDVNEVRNIMEEVYTINNLHATIAIDEY